MSTLNQPDPQAAGLWTQWPNCTQSEVCILGVALRRFSLWALRLPPTLWIIICPCMSAVRWTGNLEQGETPHVYEVVQTSSSTASCNSEMPFVDYSCKIRADISITGTYFLYSYKYRGFTHESILKLGYCCFYLSKSSEHVIHCWQQSWLNYQPILPRSSLGPRLRRASKARGNLIKCKSVSKTHHLISTETMAAVRDPTLIWY